MEHHFLREHSRNPDREAPPRAAASPLALARPLRQRQRRGALPGNSHRVTANFPGKLLGFLLAPVTEAAAKSAAGVLAAAVGPPGREPPLVRPGSSRKGPGLKFKIHFPPRPGLAAPPGTLRQPPRLSPSPAPDKQWGPSSLEGQAGSREYPAADPCASGDSQQPTRAHTHVCVCV